MSDKRLQSAEEKDEKIIEITEHKKKSAFDQTNESNRILKTIKTKYSRHNARWNLWPRNSGFQLKLLQAMNWIQGGRVQ